MNVKLTNPQQLCAARTTAKKKSIYIYTLGRDRLCVHLCPFVIDCTMLNKYVFQSSSKQAGCRGPKVNQSEKDSICKHASARLPSHIAWVTSTKISSGVLDHALYYFTDHLISRCLSCPRAPVTVYLLYPRVRTYPTANWICSQSFQLFTGQLIK